MRPAFAQVGGLVTIPPYPSAVRYVEQYGGVDLCAKIAAAIATLPSGGGIVDARGAVGAQTCATNPFAATVPVEVLLGAVTLTTDDNIVISENVTVRGLRYRPETTIIKAAGDFAADYTNTDSAARRAVVVLGAAGDAVAQGAHIENVTIDCSDIASSIGLYSESAQEGSGVRRVFLVDCSLHGIYFEDTASATTQNTALEEISILMSNDPDLDANAIGVYLDGAGGQIRVDRMTVNVRSGTGNMDAALRVARFTGHFSNLHLERATDGVLLGADASGQSNSMTFSVVDGSSTITNLFHIDTTSVVTNVTLENILRNSSTTLILDDPAGETINVDKVASYTIGGTAGGYQLVTFSATPTFSATLGGSFKITLTANVTSSTLSNAIVGQVLRFIICQDATGSRTFVWPTNVLGGMTIGSTLSTCSAQTFLYDGTNAYALASGVTGM
jgi:hypothetical protein